MTRLRSWIYSIYMGTCALIVAVFGFWTLFNWKWALKASKLWNRMAFWGLKVICGVEGEVTGQENLPEGPAIIAAKHQSMWETVALCFHLPAPAFVLKKELGDIPIFGWWCRRSGFIFVDRSAGAKALRKMVDDAKAAVARGTTHIIIFPEGTRTRVGGKAPYQPGLAALAKALELPIVPVAHNSGVFWQHPSGLKVPGKITLEYLPPLSPNQSRAALMNAVEEKIETETRRLEAAGIRQRDGVAAPKPKEANHVH